MRKWPLRVLAKVSKAYLAGDMLDQPARSYGSLTGCLTQCYASESAGRSNGTAKVSYSICGGTCLVPPGLRTNST